MYPMLRMSRASPFGSVSRLTGLAALMVFLCACAPATAPGVSPSVEPAKLGPTSTLPPTAPAPTLLPPAPTAAPIPPPNSEDWRRGPDNADFTLLVYSDFQCPACHRLAGVLAELQAIHPQDLQVVFRPYPLWPVHDKALIAAQAAEAAGAQGQFWAMHDLLFGAFAEWADLSPEEFRQWLGQAARTLPLEPQAFDQAMQAGTYTDEALRDFETAFASGLTGVPTVFLNQKLVAMQPSLTNLEALLRLMRAEAQGLPQGPPAPADPAQVYRAVLETTLGPIEIELDSAAAPQAVGSFIYLARQGWYDGTIFHRVVPGAVAETGDPTHTGLAGPAYRFVDEFNGELSFAEAGRVALRSEGPDSNGGIFFINLQPLPELDGTRTIFGRVVSGLELLQQLPARDPLADLLLPAPLVIERVTILP